MMESTKGRQPRDLIPPWSGTVKGVSHWWQNNWGTSSKRKKKEEEVEKRRCKVGLSFEKEKKSKRKEVEESLTCLLLFKAVYAKGMQTREGSRIGQGVVTDKAPGQPVNYFFFF